ncbi:MAG: hypothetical protein AAFP86_15075, partial [Planctomycetota bacterium]
PRIRDFDRDPRKPRVDGAPAAQGWAIELWGRAVAHHVAALEPVQWNAFDVRYRQALADLSWGRRGSRDSRPRGWLSRLGRGSGASRDGDDARGPFERSIEAIAPHAGPRVALQLAALHREGRVRQAAVTRLADEPAAVALGPLTVRLADWVPLVRRAAEEAWGRVVSGAELGTLTRFVPLVDVVQGSPRADRERNESALDRRWAEPDGGAALWAMSESDSRPTRRCALERILRGRFGGATPNGIARLAASPRTDVRWRAFVTAAALPPSTERTDLLIACLSDRAPLVRVSALRALHEDDAAPEGLAASFVLDRARRVRAVARFHAERRDPGFDAVALYREHVRRDGPALFAAIAGLSEAGSEHDAELLVPLLDDPRSDVSMRALDGVIALAPRLAEERLRDLRSHERASVRIHALRALAALGIPADPDAVARELDGSLPADERVRRASLVRTLPAPARLDAILRLHEECEDPEIRGVALRELALLDRSLRHAPTGRAMAALLGAPPSENDARDLLGRVDAVDVGPSWRPSRADVVRA